MKCIYRAVPLVLALTLTTPVFAKDYTNHWAKPAIDKWKGYQIVSGYEDGSFKPNATVTRAELAGFISRTFGLTDSSNRRQFTDVAADKWYTAPINQVTNLGIMYTPGDKFYPHQPVTREEAAYAFYRAYQIPYTETTQLVDYRDYYDISTWAADAIGSLMAGGYMQGYEDNTFRPQGSITRAEIVKMLDNLSPHRLSTPQTYSQDLKGSAIISGSEITLKDMTINGNLYINVGVGAGKVTLDNVKVTGTLYIDGGTVNLSGDFQKVEIDTPHPVHFQKGTAKEILIEKEGANLTLEAGTVTDHLLILEESTVAGKGTIKEITDFRGEKLQLTTAGVYIRGEFHPIEVQGNRMIIDLPYLNTKYSTQDLMNGLQINANKEGAYLNSYAGQMQTNTRYDFRMANKVTGILDEMLEEILDMNYNLREMADMMGITGESAFDVLGVDNSVSIYTMLDKYNLVKDLVYDYTGVTIPNEYTFKRELCYPGETPVPVEIHLIVNK